TCYYFQCTEGFEENLRMLLHFVSTPYFTDETVAKEQGIIGQEIRMGEDNPGLAVYYNLLKLLYAHHPIRDRVAGTVESIREITAQTLYDCHRVFYAPSNMVLCVEGDVEPDEIERIAAEALPAERAPVPRADFGEPEGLLPAEAFRSEAMEVSAPQFLIGLKLPEGLRGGEALRLRLTATLALRMLCGSSSPFFTRLYAEGLLNTDFDYEVDAAADTLTVIVGGESRDPGAVLAQFRDECARVAREGFEDAYFERARRASLGARLRGLEDFDNVCVSLASGVFDGFCALDAFRLLGELSAEDCRRFAEEYLKPERMAMSVITPKKV
ncbi:MAG: pitrilysin family protein, partial [Eubacteriales bacterium]|nr:pitrilysin family protein [Eubacteriales bacterium]